MERRAVAAAAREIRTRIRATASVSGEGEEGPRGKEPRGVFVLPVGADVWVLVITR